MVDSYVSCHTKPNASLQSKFGTHPKQTKHLIFRPMDSNFFVPDFGIEEEDSFSTVFDLRGSKTLTDPEEEGLAEIPWQKGPAFRQFPLPEDLSSRPPCDMFIEEDEMSSWLHRLPENPQSVENALVKPMFSPTVAPATPAVSRPSITPPVRPVLFPPHMVKASASRESAMVGSNLMSRMAVPPSDSMEMVGGSRTDRVCEKVMASCSFEGTRGEGQKRKSHNSNDSNVEDVEYDSDYKRDNRRQTRRSRASEVHNLSERRRRDSINEKMKALQQLIPRCNKSDKASMLHDAVEYLKSLQYQIQMMSMGCTMDPMMFLGIPQYPAQMGIPMGMGVDPGSRYYTHPMLPFSPVVHPFQLPRATTAHLGARMPMPMYNPSATVGQQIPQAANLPDRQRNFMGLQGSNVMQLPNLVNPCNPYFGLQHMQASPQTAAEPETSNGSGAPEKEF